jgi:hypothetical protein
MKQINYYVDMKPTFLQKSIHCQICNAIIFPLTFSDKGIQEKCKCTKEELKKRKVYK